MIPIVSLQRPRGPFVLVFSFCMMYDGCWTRIRVLTCIYRQTCIYLFFLHHQEFSHDSFTLEKHVNCEKPKFGTKQRKVYFKTSIHLLWYTSN